MTKKILYFDWHSEASEFYRGMPLDYIKSKNLEVTRSNERQITSHLLNAYDIIFILRPSSSAHLNIIKLAKDLGKKVLIDYDDDPLHLPKTNPMFFHYNDNKQYIIQCLVLSDEIWVSTKAIKDSFRLYNNNIHIIPNCHDDFIFKVKEKRKFTVNKFAMWRGGGSHIGDIYQPGTTEWILKTINDNKKWNFYWFGQNFDFIRYRIKNNNFHYNPGASTIQFYKLMHETNANIFFYPLTDNVFNRSKSSCSWLESTYSGSAYFGKKEFDEFDKPGVFNLNQLQDALKKSDLDLLEKANNISWEYLKDTHLLSKVNKVRLDRLCEL